MKVVELPFMRNCWELYDQQCFWRDDKAFFHGSSVIYDFYEMWFTTKEDYKYNRDIKKQIDVHVVNDIANIIMSYLVVTPVVGNKFFCERQQDEMNYHRRISS